MLNKTAHGIVNYMFNHFPDAFDLSKKDVMRFGAEAFMSETFKLLAYIIFFHTIGALKTFLIAIFIYGIYRGIAGGYHFKSFTACFIGSGLYFYTLLFVSQMTQPFYIANSHILFTGFALNILIGCLLTPVPTSHYRVPKSKYSQKKIKFLLFSLLLFTLTPYLSTSALLLNSLIFFNIQLYIGGLKNGNQKEFI